MVRRRVLRAAATTAARSDAAAPVASGFLRIALRMALVLKALFFLPIPHDLHCACRNQRARLALLLIPSSSGYVANSSMMLLNEKRGLLAYSVSNTVRTNS